MAKRVLTLTLLGLGVSALVGLLLFVWLVVLSPGDAIRQENIKKLLAKESPVYYSDGQTKVGVFFQQAHRQYVPYERIPKDFVNAIVAAEDRTFFRHHGVNFLGVARAMLANIRAGRVVQGGSTLTQQTAKNLFKRKDRSFTAKLKELLYAWRLEYHYPKEKILEFYANQFYVSGNGRGLGVAARYYFDKSVEELDPLECAFIAGSVKRPNYYNPFRKKDEEKTAARKRAKERVVYVLGQMYRLGMLSAAEYQKQIDRDIPFRQGRMYYSLNTIMDLVKEGLADPEVEEALSSHGIDNVATSGIRIITTVEKDLQESALYSLRKELSRLDTRLRGYDQAAMQAVYAGLPFGSDLEKQRGGFLVGRIVTVEQGDSPSVAVSFDQDNTPQGSIDKKGLMNLVEPLARYRRQRWSEANARDLADLLKQLHEGDLVYVSVRDIDALSKQDHLDLEKYPLLEGAVLALQEGKIRAMAGGMENRYYNRAIMAKRPVGSVMKPLLYCAALQLGWNTLDILNNRRDVFVYQNAPYFPRPDHKSPHGWVSMSWAGVHSENLASVWLLYHLSDRLAPAQFNELADHLGLGRQPGESYRRYQRRIRDDHGVVVDRDALYEASFERAVGVIEPDLLFDGKLEESETLKSFHYGAGFDKFLVETEAEFFAGKDTDKKRVAEGNVRRAILKKSFLRFLRLQQRLRRMSETLPRSQGGVATNLYYDRSSGRYVYAEQDAAPGWETVGWRKINELRQSLAPEEWQRFWDEVSIEGELSVSTLSLLEEAMAREYDKLAAMPPYSPEVLYYIHDFKVLVSLRYLTGLSRALGIESTLDPVLSFPLGSNVISILEMARAYEGLRSGNIYTNGGQQSNDGLAVIARIEDSDGDIIYEPRRHVSRVVDPKISLAVTDILRNVMKFGTGRSADQNIRLHSRDPQKEAQLKVLDLRIPVFGKTGTANRFTNAAFAGFIPGRGEGGSLLLDKGYVLTAYVGFDDNTPMVRNTTHITGATGALPVWTDLANAIFLDRGYATSLDLADLSFSGVLEVPLARQDLGQVKIPVAASRGGVVTSGTSGRNRSQGGKATVTTFGKLAGNGEFQSARFFQPYWQTWEK